MAVNLPTRSKRFTRVVLYAELLALDIVALLAGPLLAVLILHPENLGVEGLMAPVVVMMVYLALAFAREGYSLRAISDSLASIRTSVFSYAYAFFVVLMVAFFLKASTDISRLTFGLGSGMTVFFLMAVRALFPRHARRVCGGHMRNDLYIVHGKAHPAVAPHHATVVDAAEIGLIPDLNDPVMLDQFGTLVAGFDRVLVDCPAEHQRAWSLVLKGANVNGELLVEHTNEIGVIAMGKYGAGDTLIVARQPLSLHNRLQKRVLDVGIAGLAIVFLSPLLLVVALAIKLESPGPVLFRQIRLGRGNRLFRVLKFRSMKVESCDNTGSRSTSREDNRVTRVGRFIRATSIDELPQLFNVLMGSMSLVGPRPHALGSTAGSKLFWHIDETYWLRHQLKPGITGLAQMRGHRGATLQVADLVNRLQSDLEYIQGWSIWRDLAIIVGTLRVVVHRNAF